MYVYIRIYIYIYIVVVVTYMIWFDVESQGYLFDTQSCKLKGLSREEVRCGTGGCGQVMAGEW